jgi:drug/metabolite transporter (DMT)-like permease
MAWASILATTVGLLVASWPKAKPGQALSLSPKSFAAGFYGLASGACFAVSANCFRFCGQAIDPQAVFFSSCFTLVVVQSLQSLGLGGLLYVFDRGALRALQADLKASGVAGLAGAAASACWFAALAMAPAALIRAVNALVEAPAATLVGWFRFKEALDLRRGLGSVLIVSGVVALVWTTEFA